jgi:hypothetical protein
VSDIVSITNKIRQIGPMLPGSLETIYTVCGKPGCRCKDKENPRKHGPYYRLSYSLAGRNSTMFVKQQDVQAVKTMVDNYKKFRELSIELALATLDSVKQVGVIETIELSARSSETTVEVDTSWKDKCRKRTRQLKAAAVKIRDLINSRDKWRRECLELRSNTKATTAKHRDAQSSQTSEAGEKK